MSAEDEIRERGKQRAEALAAAYKAAGIDIERSTRALTALYKAEAEALHAFNEAWLAVPLQEDPEKPR